MSIVQTVVQKIVSLVPDKPSDPLSHRHGAIGQALDRLDGPQKVRGQARFAAEVALPGMAYAAIVCSTIAKGRIEHIESAAAEAAPGVLAVLTHLNIPRMKAPPQMFSDRTSASPSNLPVMQDATIHWNGEAVAVVVAESQDQAEHAATLVRVSYSPAPAALDFDAALGRAHQPKDVIGEPAEVKVGDAQAALAAAPVRIDALYRTPRYHHNSIEPHAVVAHWEADDALTLHDATQYLAGTRHTVAEVFGLKEDRVRVLSPFVGGGFGAKTVWSHTLLAIAAAKAVGRPVRLALTRPDVFRLVGGRTLSVQRVALGARADGTLAALIHTGTTAVVTHNAFPEQFSFPARHAYAADTLHVAQKVVELDMVANTSMRAPGESIGTFALESALDELAVATGIDPVELRRRLEPEKDPTTGHPISGRHLIEAFRRGAERFGWASRPPAPRSQRDGEWLIGQGVATATYPYYRMTGGSARIRLYADGRAVVSAAAHEMGMATATVQTQHAAERLGLPLAQVSFEYGDSSLPDSPVAGGSSQTVSVGAAVIAAAERLERELVRLAGKDSPLHGARTDQLVARDAGLWWRDEPTRGERYASILARVDRAHLEVEAAAPQATESSKYAMHSFGAQFCEVRVSEVTGEVRVARWVGSFDTGRIINPKTARSQFRGGIIMGIGMALMEESYFDERSGRFMNPTLAEYHVPVHLDIPEIDVIWNDIPDPHSPLGARGIGEIGITGTAAAVANAIYNATGKRVRDYPITPDKIMRA